MDGDDPTDEDDLGAEDDLEARREDAVDHAPAEPPVVARMVVEIRSDGRRTIARGALEDLERGERVAIEAESTTPLALAGALARALIQTPRIAGALSGAPRAAHRTVKTARRTVRTLRALLPPPRGRER